MEISFLDSSILDESIEVVIDLNSNEVLTSTINATFRVGCSDKQWCIAWLCVSAIFLQYALQRSFKAMLIISHINALGPSTAMRHMFDDDE
ncbi:hypothetical protein DPMN_170269 [Dreissena polymorpha]|uniref:Uncharacterized protein n=1 Tax=Dreissena polymorpha TaxID=45954 RepID=A0A9D4DZG0_DREPO|nr:hypothetical protein DPMN_170269 [Dreissena polymorpha]